MREDRPHKQEDIEDPILALLEHGGVMTTAGIARLLKAQLPLTAADRATANKRQNESKIDQVIANALQEQRRLCKKGLVERVGHGEFQITSAGKRYLADHRRDVEIMAAELDALLDRTNPK